MLDKWETHRSISIRIDECGICPVIPVRIPLFEMCTDNFRNKDFEVVSGTCTDPFPKAALPLSEKFLCLFAADDFSHLDRRIRARGL